MVSYFYSPFLTEKIKTNVLQDSTNQPLSTARSRASIL